MSTSLTATPASASASSTAAVASERTVLSGANPNGVIPVPTMCAFTQATRRVPYFLIAQDATATTMTAPMIAPTIPPQSNLSSSPMPNRPAKIQ